MSVSELAGFEHRGTYDVAAGRDRWSVRLVNDWVSAAVPAPVSKAAAGAVLDVGCGEQPFRSLVEARGSTRTPMEAMASC
jgi:hypothetical protein